MIPLPLSRSVRRRLVLFAIPLLGMGSGAMAAPKVSVMPSYTQLSIYANAEVGQPITVWGRTFDGVAPYTYTLDFGDGSPVQSGAVTDPDEISAVHTYTTAGLKTFTLTVTDNNNETTSRSGVIRAIIDPTHEQKVNMAVSKAKLYLYRTRIEISDSGNDLVKWYGSNGGTTRNEYSMGASAAVILAFEQVGHLPGNDRELDIYSDMVEKGLEWLTYVGQETTISNQPHGNPDSNGNGKGVLFYTSSSHQTYANAFVGLAFVAAEKEIAGAQARTIKTGNLAGRTYYSLVEDLADQFAYCQSDSNPTWGGWQYGMNTSSSTSGFDGSSTQWIAFFLESARDLWGINPPAWVVDRMCTGYFTQRQNTSSGGIGYSSSLYSVNTAKTGGALGAYKLGGYTLDTDTAQTNVSRAVGFIGDYYTSTYSFLGNNASGGGVFGCWYATYSVKRGMVLQEIDRLDTVIGERDWQTDIDLWLLGDASQLPASINPGERSIGHMFGQQADGSWSNSAESPGSTFREDDMNTAMGILMLTRSLPRPRPVSIITPVGQQSNKPLARAFQMTGQESYHLDPNASIIEYLWDFDDSDGLDWDNPGASGVNVTNPGYDTVGTYVVTLRVGDNGDPAFYDTYTIEVEVVDTDVAPVAVPIPNGVYSGRVNQPITLDGSASYDADGDPITEYSWDTDGNGTFGDAFGVNPQVTYTSEYVGQVGLRVTAGGVTSVNTAYADIIVSGTDLSVQSFFASNVDPNVKADLEVTIKSDDQSTNDYTDVQLKFYNGDPLNGGIQVGIPYTFDILKGDTAVVTVADFMVNGADDLTVWIDSNQGVPEWDEDNNFATANVSKRPLINETDAITENGGQHQFIELFDGGSGTTPLDDFTVVLYDGADSESYRSIDLTGQSTNADGYFVIGTAAVANVDLVLPDGFLQSGEDAVAIHELPSTDFPDGTAATTNRLIDAVVHGSGQGDGAALATALDFVGNPLDESAAGHAVGHSLQRLPNGGGNPRTAAGFSALSPTPGLENTLPPAPENLDLTDASDSGDSNSDDLTNDRTPIITGTARAGSVVTVYSESDWDADGELGLDDPLAVTFADASGNWSVELPEPHPAAISTATVEFLAIADGGPASDPLAIHFDFDAPPAPSNLTFRSDFDTGVSNMDGITNSATIQIDGDPNPSTRIHFVSSIDGPIGSLTLDASGGNWGQAFTNLSEGSHTVTATATDPAGNVSGLSNAVVFTLDYTAPTLQFGKDAGQADPAMGGPVIFTAAFSESVHGFEDADVSTGGSAGGNATVNGTGATYSVSVATTAAEGTVTASVGAGVATDTAGNPSSAPVLGDTLVVLDVHSADNPSELTFSNDSASIPGWLEPGDSDVFTFTLTEPKIVTAQTSGSVDTRGSLHDSTDTLLNDPDADSDALDGHNFQISEVLPPGVYTVVVTSEGSAQSGAYTLSISLEDIPVLINEVDADTGDNHDLEFVELWDGGEGETPLDGYVLVFYRGDTQQSYLAVDLDGLATDADGFFLIGNAAVTGIHAELPADSIRDGRDAVALYFGDADDFPEDTPLTTTDLLDAVVCLPEGEAEGPELAGLLLPGEPQLDESENGFRDGQSLQRIPDGEGGPRVTTDFVAAAPTPGAPNELPPAPGTPDLLPGSDSGTSDNDDLTNVVRPSFSGTARPGSIILVDSDQDALVGTAYTLPDGTWTLASTDFDLSEGIHQVSASTLAAETHSTGEASAALTVEIDITAPDAPTALDLLTASDSGIAGDDDVTSDNTPTISGDAEVDSTVVLFSGADEIGTGTSTGQWTITASLLPDAVHSLAAEATDPAGNTSARSGVLEVTVDTQSPGVSVDQGPTQSDPGAAGSVSFAANFTEPVFGFGMEDVTTTGIAGTVDVTGGPSNYSITVATTADEGFVTAEVLAAGATDRAGNPNTASSSTDNHVAVDRDDAPGGGPTPLPSIGGTGSIPAYLHDGDTDTFVFTLTRPRITILYTTGMTDTVGELKDDTGRLRNDPAADDDAGDGENFRTSVPLPAGTYTITVSSAGIGDYELFIEAIALPFIQPDLTVNSKGRKIYGSPAGQSVSKKAKKMRSVKFSFSLINDAQIVDKFLVRSSRHSRYFKTLHKNSAGENITASLKTGNHRTSLVDASGTAITFSTRIEPKANRLKKRTAGVHTGYRKKSYRCGVTATSMTLPERQDSVSAKVKSKRIIDTRDDGGPKPEEF